MAFRRFLPLLACCLLSVLPVSAQESKGIVGLVLDWIKAPSRELDSAAVYQPAPRWSVAVTGDVRNARISQTQEFSIDYPRLFPTEEAVPGSVSARLVFDNSLGISVGYGKISLSAGKKFGGNGTDKTFTFDYIGAGYAARIQRFLFAHPINYDFVLGEPGSSDYSTFSDVTANPGKLRAYILDGFYAFNRRGFAYSAAYKGGVCQRHSAGSWLFGTKVILGEFSYDPSEDIVAVLGFPAKQGTAQVSFGCGYSFNYVPLHRQPHGEKEEGLKNLTFNATLIPMFTIFNQSTCTTYVQKGGKYVQDSRFVMNSRMQVSYVARAAVGYKWGLNSTNLSFSYDSYDYSGLSDIPYDGGIVENVSVAGRFSRWSGQVRYCRSF